MLKAAVVAAVVVTLSVEICAVAPLTEAGESAQVAGSPAATGAMAQVSATGPINPSAGVTLIVEILPVVAPEITVMLPLFVRLKLGVIGLGRVSIRPVRISSRWQLEQGL
jgi:hypothetical protein